MLIYKAAVAQEEDHRLPTSHAEVSSGKTLKPKFPLTALPAVSKCCVVGKALHLEALYELMCRSVVEKLEKSPIIIL